MPARGARSPGRRIRPDTDGSLATSTIRESVTWRVESVDTNACRLNACVWAVFPTTLSGSFVASAFEHLLNGIADDRQHARRELEYLRNTIESSPHGKIAK